MEIFDEKHPLIEPQPGPLADAVRKRNIPLLSLSSRKTPVVVQMGYGYKQKRRVASDVNDSAGAFLCLQKDVAKELLDRCGFPVPKGFSEEDKEEFLKKLPHLDYPIVIKPSDSIWGIGVTTNINNAEAAAQAFQLAKKTSPTIIAEEFVPGNDYRVLIINDKFIAAMHRAPARVFGNGQDTVEELVLKENKKRKKALANNPYSLKPIKIDQNTRQLLSSTGKDLDHIPELKEEVQLKMNSNIKSGGEGIDVTNEICSENKNLIRRAAQVMALDIAGFDIQAERIDKPITETGGKIIEVNSNPDIFMHLFPSNGDPIDAPGILIDYLFPDPEDAWIDIELDGKVCRDEKFINAHLADVPKLVTRLVSTDSKETKDYTGKQNLLSYLLDKLTVKIKIN